MRFIALKTCDGTKKGKLAFYCRMLDVSRQGFYNYLKRANSLGNMSDETRARRRASKLKPLTAKNNETGEELFFPSLDTAADYFGVKSSAISRWCYGTRKPSVNYTFHYLSTNNDCSEKVS